MTSFKTIDEPYRTKITTSENVRHILREIPDDRNRSADWDWFVAKAYEGKHGNLHSYYRVFESRSFRSIENIKHLSRFLKKDTEGKFWYWDWLILLQLHG